MDCIYIQLILLKLVTHLNNCVQIYGHLNWHNFNILILHNSLNIFFAVSIHNQEKNFDYI